MALLRTYLLVGLLVLACWPAVAADVLQERADLNTKYAKQLEELAAWCDGQKLAVEAQQIRQWLPKQQPDTLTVFLLPNYLHPSAEREETATRPWRVRWQALRDAQADALFELAQRAATTHHTSLAYDLVVETVRENPQHRKARQILGYVQNRDAWRTPFEVTQLGASTPKVWHERFGWLPKAHVERYEQGQRNFNGRWVSEAEEAKLRADARQPWRVETDHYIVTTSHSLEEGVELAKKLETLHAVWEQTFAGYFLGESELQRRFAGKAATRDNRKHSVVYFRDREEYNQALRAMQPRIEITLGIYFSQNTTAYFFAGRDQNPGTLFHEATHQLFHEVRTVNREVGRDANFWIVEGIACYMESLEIGEDRATLGGRDNGRMPAARHRLLKDNFYVPLEQFVRAGQNALQTDPRIATLYSQASGLATFFMHGDNGNLRDPLMRYLEAVYTGRANYATLSNLTEAEYATLDKQYHEFMSQGAEAKPKKEKADEEQVMEAD